MKIAKHTRMNTCAVLTFLMLLCAICIFSNGNKVKAIEVDDPITISGQVIWNDNDNSDGLRPTYVKFALLADGTETGKSASLTQDLDGAWGYKFENLPKYDTDGKEINYTVELIGSLEGYTMEQDSYNFSFTREVKVSDEPETIQLEITITWDDDDNSLGLRPEYVGYQILDGDGEPRYGSELSSGEGWKFTCNVEKCMTDGREAKYTLVLDSVDNYECTIEGYNAILTLDRTLLDKTNNVSDNNNSDKTPNNTLQTGENSSHMNLALLLILISSVSLSYIFIKNKGNSVEL